MTDQAEKQKVLVVDDSHVIRNIITGIIRKIGYDPLTASDGDEAIALLQYSPVDAILLDISMPGRNGIEVLRHLTNNDTLVPVIMISGSGDIEQAVECIKLGAYEYLTKPIDGKRLEITLKNALSESALKQQVRLLSAAMDQSPIAVVITGRDGKIEYTNPAFHHLYAGKKTALPGSNIRGAEKHLGAFYRKLPETVASKEIWEGEFLKKGKKGQQNWVRAIVSPIFNSKENVSHVLALLQDITAVKNSREELAESNKRFRDLSNLLPQPVFESDSRGYITYSNRAGFNTFGYRPEDLRRGIHALRFFAPEERARVTASLQENREDLFSRSHEYIAMKNDGTRFPVLVYTAPVTGRNGTIGLRGLVVDITERKQAEEQLHENQKKYHNLFQAIPDAIIVADIDTGSLVEWNREALQLFEYSPEELRSMNIRELYPEELRSSADEYFLKALQQLAERFETQIITKHGLRIDVHVSSAIFTTTHHRRFVGIIRDISEQKRSECLIRENVRLKNDFISTVSHELRTPLFSILGFTSTIMRDVDELDRETLFEFLQIIHDESKRLSALIEDVLMISKIDSGRVSYKKTGIDPSLTLAEVCRSLKIRAEEKDILLKLDVQIPPVRVYADPDALKQAAINIIGNALKFTAPGGTVSVAMKYDDHSMRFIVKDTGTGIPEEDLERIFEKFYRVNRPGEEIEGTGLGLPIVKEIIDAHEGTIEVTSRLHEGTEFTISLPLMNVEMEATA
ncbi:MAG: PAS domain S-box protein [Chlorobiaceae bacterium]|nr:PAS domain S-box protein [Chlorobiaceae bacterium]NTV61113.1 PAS domain S-box protein [Chlorobiaceae bacterium]